MRGTGDGQCLRELSGDAIMRQAASSAQIPVAQAGGLDQKGGSSARWLVTPSTAVLVITVVGGVLMSVLFDRKFYGQGIARLLASAPFFVMPTVSALIWKNMILHPVYGLIAQGMRAIGMQPIDWFADYPLTAIIMIVAWQWLPFAFLTCSRPSSRPTRSRRKPQRSTAQAHSRCFSTSHYLT